MKRKAESVTVACPIVYGSIAFSLGKKAGESATHKWTLFLRGPSDEDLSVFIDKVVFSLHPSFAQPVREVYSSPFEITETGWGEFEAGIRVFFKDPNEQALDITQMIKLYHGTDRGQSSHLSKQPVMNEYYDEIVFTDPAPDFYRQLMMYTPPLVRRVTDMTEHYSIFSDQEDVRLLTLAQDHITAELEVAKEKLIRLESELQSAAQMASLASHSVSSGAAGATSSSGAGFQSAQGTSGPGRKKSAAANIATGSVKDPAGSSAPSAKAPRQLSSTDRRRAANRGLPPKASKLSKGIADSNASASERALGADGGATVKQEDSGST